MSEEGVSLLEDPVRLERDELACELVNNNTSPPPGRYCPGTFDTWVCWPPTPANSTAFAPCPDFVPGFSSLLVAHKECTADGSWLAHPATGRAWSNYTLCVERDERPGGLVLLYEVGYALSLAALLAALLVLGHFRALRCARTTLHAHLFAAFALNNALWLAWYGLVVRAPAVLAAGPIWCRALHSALQYALLATYTWMLCEGLYLHTVLVASFVSERRLLRALVPLGWLLPVPSVIAHVSLRARDRAPLCWLYEGAPAELAALAAVAVLLNAALLVNIVRVLCGKLRAGAGAAPPSQNSAALQALRATCLLAPLLGVQYLLLPVRPARDGAGWMLYEVVAALCGSLQGACVAVLYCFCNGEVRAQLRRRWRAITFRPRANSTTNTTVSFVRSTPGTGEEKV